MFIRLISLIAKEFDEFLRKRVLHVTNKNTQSLLGFSGKGSILADTITAL